MYTYNKIMRHFIPLFFKNKAVTANIIICVHHSYVCRRGHFVVEQT